MSLNIRTRAADLFAYLETEYGPRLSTLVLKADLLLAGNKPSATELNNVIGRMTRMVILSHNSFTTILLYIQKLRTLDANLAREALLELLETRLYDHGDQLLIDKAVVMAVYVCSEPANTGASAVASLQGLMESVHQSGQSPLAEEATHAAQALMWKTIESSIQNGKTDVGEHWCRLALHPLLASSGDSNRSKMARKLMIIALSSGNNATAREAYSQMPRSGQRVALSQYLLYIHAILCLGM